MAIFETYSQSQKNNIIPFVYDSIPNDFKIQLIHTWNDFLKQDKIPPHFVDEVIKEIEKHILKEHGILALPETFFYSSKLDKIQNYFQIIKDVNRVLDVILFFCIFIEASESILKSLGFYFELTIKGDDIIKETNERFKFNGIGYQYCNKKIIRLDSELLHYESVEKTISLLNNPTYDNVNYEYLKALEHFRFNRNADCLTWCMKAYESMIKIIATNNRWIFKQNDTYSTLTKLLFTNNFFSSLMFQPLDNLRVLLENSINTLRNNRGGHGSGTELNIVPESLAKYMLYLTGSTLLLLLDTQKEYEK